MLKLARRIVFNSTILFVHINTIDDVHDSPLGIKEN